MLHRVLAVLFLLALVLAPRAAPVAAQLAVVNGEPTAAALPPVDHGHRVYLPMLARSLSVWTRAGDLSQPRCQHTATLLPSGQVLVAGGWDRTAIPAVTATAELYDPASNAWTSTAPMSRTRSEHSATLLPTGKVLVVGGDRDLWDMRSTAELYDPETHTWMAAAQPLGMRSGIGHTATLLPSGKVLVVGGNAAYHNIPWEPSAEVYDPMADTWTSTGEMAWTRDAHTATLLPSGKVLVVGGRSRSFACMWMTELYDPGSNAWSLTADSPRPGRCNHTATLLPSGRVLVAGGYREEGESLASAEIYDPATDAWSAAAAMREARSFHTATLLTTGRVLVTGGLSPAPGWPPYFAIASAEVYDEATEGWIARSMMASPRNEHTATPLLSGTVLVVGQYLPDGSTEPGTAELYDPAAQP